MNYLFSVCFLFVSLFSFAQLQWQNVDSVYGPLPKSVRVYFTNQAIDTSPFRAFYVIADLKDKGLEFTTDTTLNRRLTPAQFYGKNEKPLLVVNGTFFSFETNRNLNIVVKDGKLVSHNIKAVKAKASGSLMYYYPLRSAIGIDDNRNADVARIFTDSIEKFSYSFREGQSGFYGQDSAPGIKFFKNFPIMRGCIPFISFNKKNKLFYKWKMRTAIGGGPMLVHDGSIKITNEEERMFTGKAIDDKHPRTAMGYTADNKLIILVIEGRTKEAGGATLLQAAQILKDLGCVEALNLDGGGSSCLLINGKETIKPSDKTGQRPIPAVFLIKENIDPVTN